MNGDHGRRVGRGLSLAPRGRLGVGPPHCPPGVAVPVLETEPAADVSQLVVDRLHREERVFYPICDPPGRELAARGMAWAA